MTKIAHLFAHSISNSGDRCVHDAVQYSLLRKYPEAEFDNIEILNTPIDESHIERINACDFAVLGGGGLIHPNYDSISSWQFQCSIELMDAITVPLIVYAIGFDQFRKQNPFEKDKFIPHINHLISKSAYFSVRNTGSKQALQPFINAELYDKIQVDFCPTISTAHYLTTEKPQTNNVGLLFAGDFAEYRHSDRIAFLQGIKKIVSHISANNQQPCFIMHDGQDGWYHYFFDDIPIYNLMAKGLSDVIEVYKNMTAVVSDRGHSVMIPFGIGCKVCPAVSHNKINWFLQDVDMLEYATESETPNLAESIISKLYRDDDYYEKRLAGMNKILDNYEKTLETIKGIIR